MQVAENAEQNTLEAERILPVTQNFALEVQVPLR